jgi:hypothetical protein
MDGWCGASARRRSGERTQPIGENSYRGGFAMATSPFVRALRHARASGYSARRKKATVEVAAPPGRLAAHGLR